MITLILAILTIGAASAEDVSDDLAVVDADIDVNLSDVSVDSISKDDFNISHEDQIAVNCENEVISVLNDDADGNLTVTVNNSQTPVYNNEFKGNSSISLSDLKIADEGTYNLDVKFISGSKEIDLLNYDLTVTKQEWADNITVTLSSVAYLNEFRDLIEGTDLAFWRCSGPIKGNMILYIDGNPAVIKDSSEFWMGLSDLNQKLTVGEHQLDFKYRDEQNKTYQIKSGTVDVRYVMGLMDYCEDNFFQIGTNQKLRVFLPNDADGDLFLILDGKEYKVEYSDGVGVCTVPTKDLKVNKNYNVYMELRNDSFYPYKKFSDTLVTCFRFEYADSIYVGQKETISIVVPTKYSGVLSIYKTKKIKNKPNPVKTGKAIASVKTVKGKASVSLSNFPKKYNSYYVQFKSGKTVYSDIVYFSVKKNPVTISLKKVKVKKSAKKLEIKATVKKNGEVVKNKKMKLKFNKKTITAKTNSKGVVKFTISKSILKKLKVGTKIQYKLTYLGKTAKRTVYVSR